MPKDEVKWGLFDLEKDEIIPPRKYSSKNQLDLIKEVVEALGSHDLVFVQGAVGTGKSVIALHVIANYGKGIIQTPTKALEDQYQKDYYLGSKRILCNNGYLKVMPIRGRDNFPCPYYENKVTCGYDGLPCKRPLRDEFEETRFDVAKECPYWNPVVKLEIGKNYASKLGESYIPYNAVGGAYCYVSNQGECPFLSQYIAYTMDNVAIVMNSAIWELETFSKRKASVPIEIIDEGDAYLDSLCFRVSVSKKTLENIFKKHKKNLAKKLVEEIIYEFSKALKFANAIRPAKDVLELIMALKTLSLITGKLPRITVIAEYIDKAYVFAKDDRVTFYFPEPSFVLERLRKRSGKLVFMSATFPKPDVLEEVFGINDYEFCYGETKFPGTVYLRKTGDEMIVNYENWGKERFKKRYFELRDRIVQVATPPKLVLVWGKKYAEGCNYDFKSINILEEVDEDWSTVANRGIDLPGDKCRALILLKCPYPDLNDPILKTMSVKLGEKAFWNYYHDITERNLVQQVGRGVRYKEDWVEVWSPDKHVHGLLSKVWKGKLVIKKEKNDLHL